MAAKPRHHNPIQWRGQVLADGAALELQCVFGPRCARVIGRQLALQLRYPNAPPALWQTIAWVANADEAEGVIEKVYGAIFEVERIPDPGRHDWLVTTHNPRPLRDIG